MIPAAVLFAACGVLAGSAARYNEVRRKPCVGLYLTMFIMAILSAIS